MLVRQVSLLVALSSLLLAGCGAAPSTEAPDAGSVVEVDALAPRERLAAGEPCGEDAVCESGDCAPSLGLCRAALGRDCTVEIGCAASATGERTVCMTASASVDTGTCVLGDGTAFAPCTRDEHCLDGSCTVLAGRCGNGRAGEPCDDALDCIEGLCLEGACQEGAHGARCERDEQCDGGRCRGGACVDGRDGDACDVATDCVFFCNLGTGRCGDACETSSACAPGALCTRDGRCAPPGDGAEGTSCADDLACASGSCFAYAIDDRRCAAPGGDGARCVRDADCLSGLVCDAGACAHPTNTRCGTRTLDGRRSRGACETGAECAPAGDLRTRCERSDTPCFADTDCAGDRCVLPYVCR